MIVNFRVKNFKSIKERIELSFEAAALNNLRENVIDINTVNEKEYNLLKTISIYGPNASGKSNLIKAIDFMKNFVITSNSLNKGEKLNYKPFRLDEVYTNLASEFEVDLILDGILYNYGFSSNEKIIEKEYLYYYPKGRKATVFERENRRNSIENNIEDFKFTIDKTRQDFFASMTSTNKLYLSVSTNLENQLTEKVFNWFKDKLVIHTTDISNEWNGYTTYLINENKEKKKILSFLKGADFNISDISTMEATLDDEDDFIKKISNIMKEDAFKKLVSSRDYIEVKTTKAGKDSNGNNIEVKFDMAEESDGTNKFYELAGPFIDMLSKGNCLIFDELDTKLHSNLLIFLVMLFNKNKTHAQLLFSAHNTSVLDQKYLRRDQMYFTNRNSDNSTELYSVYDFPTEKSSSNIMKRYLSGRYRAIPFIDEELVLDSILEAINA
jgi:AAA15 family ATPase/GTPase